MRAQIVILALCGVVSAQSFKGVRYLEEIGHLGTQFDDRRSADLGIATAFPADSEYTFQGVDNAGKRWRADIPIYGSGVGWADAWTGDFDHNGRRDLMIADVFQGNGRCVDGLEIVFLMFDPQHRPIPWMIETHMPKNGSYGKMPAILRDFGRSGHARIIGTACSYSEPPRFGEDRSIAGVYEAWDAHWSLVRPGDVKPYQAILRRNYATIRDVKLLPVDPDKWVDQGNASPVSEPRQIEKITPHEGRCRGVNIPIEIVEGRAVLVPREDWCDTVGRHDRITFTNGDTCYGWPTIVIDRKEGRDIVDSRSPRLETKLREAAAQHLPVKTIGQTEARCSPTMLWFTDPN